MATLLVLIGVRGAGKTSTQERLRSHSGLRVLTPSTTRDPRSADDREYDFRAVDAWMESDFAWSISAGGVYYGMRKAEIESLGEGVGITVFHPAHIEALREFGAQNPGARIVTIGLDTVRSATEVAARTGADTGRAMSSDEFNAERKAVLNSDIVLTGDLDSVVSAVLSTIELFQQRGGVLPDSLIRSFLRAGALLDSFVDSNISPASYDLRLGDDVWCQGAFESLSEKNPTLKIPPYSYAVVSAKEVARMPKFLVGRFDLKVSLFFQGVVLSNGPQVDPGYRGSLFCMLYNGSDMPVGITRGSHFATLELVTTAGLSSGYQRQYQDKQRLSDFIPGHAAVSKGGQILERFLAQDAALKAELSLLRTVIVSMASLIVAMVAISAVAFWNVRGDALRVVDQADSALKRLEAAEAKQTSSQSVPPSGSLMDTQPAAPAVQTAEPSATVPVQIGEEAGVGEQAGKPRHGTKGDGVRGP